MKWGPAFGLFVFFIPMLASAQVVINEIMYNPQGSDSGREWVELYNQGQSGVTMVGGTVKNSWRIGDSSNHTLTDPAGGVGRGSLVIPADGYLVIASDPNEFISGEYAGGAYSVAKASISLTNTGVTVSLLDGNGAVVDAVSYTSAQGASDDGSSLQRQADGSWIAALPTPGAPNSITPYVAPAPDTSQSNDTSTAPTTDQLSQAKTTQVNSSYVPPPTPDLYADAGGDRTVIADADAEFDASAYDKSQNVLDPSTVRFSWNFGDGATAEGAAVLHHFTYPGRYAVVLTIAQAKNAVSDELNVTAEPAALSFSLLQDGGTEIQNLAGHDLDLSGWIIRENGGTFAAKFILPDHSDILSGSSMNIPAQTLSFHASSSTLLEYPNGTFALSMGESSAPNDPAPALPQNAAPVPASTTHSVALPTDKHVVNVIPDVPDPSTSSDDVAPEDTSDAELDPGTTSTSTTLQTAAVASAPGRTYLWWLGVVTLAGAAGAAIVAAGYFRKREWDVIEESSE